MVSDSPEPTAGNLYLHSLVVCTRYRRVGQTLAVAHPVGVPKHRLAQTQATPNRFGHWAGFWRGRSMDSSQTPLRLGRSCPISVVSIGRLHGRTFYGLHHARGLYGGGVALHCCPKAHLFGAFGRHAPALHGQLPHLFSKPRRRWVWFGRLGNYPPILGLGLFYGDGCTSGLHGLWQAMGQKAPAGQNEVPQL